MKDLYDKVYPNGRRWNDHIDSYDFITQRGGDGGDSAQRLGMYALGWAIKHAARPDDEVHTDLRYKLEQLELPSGEWVRHPNHAMWYGQPGTMSRDNFLPLMVLMGLLGATDTLKRVFINLFVKRLGFMWNTKHIWETDGWKIPDHVMPSGAAVFMRACNSKWFYPILVMCDLWLYLNSFVRVVKSRVFDPDDVSDDLNLIIQMLWAKYRLPTFISKWATRYYVKERGKAGKNFDQLLMGFGPQTALDWYFREETGAPPMNEYYKEFLFTELIEV